MLFHHEINVYSCHVVGLTLVDDSIYVLTWKNKVLFIFDFETLSVKKTLRYDHEGWGLTYTGEYLIATDGSSRMFFYEKHNGIG